APLESFTPYRRWDNRFVFAVQPHADIAGLSVRKLGQISRNTLLKKGAARLAQLPAAVRGALPGIFRDSELFLIPEYVGLAPLPASQAVVVAGFSPRHGIFVKPFEPCSFMLTQ
ncbi:MAG TPA: hypothetical protein VHB73_04815, partial [Alphaproteobacteria bacterium]|nr:hypothetical protein [Alphaproteobacteria bacterium]